MPKVSIVALLAFVVANCGVDPPTTAPTSLPTHGTPARLELSAAPGVGQNGGTATITARVQDAYAATLPDVSVTFSATSGTLSATSMTTNASGIASALLTADAGLITVKATAGTSADATVSVTMQPHLDPSVPPPGPPPPQPAPPPDPAFSVALGFSGPTAGSPPTVGTETAFGLSANGGVTQAVWTFGDNTPSVTTVGSRAATTTHTYSTAGQVTARVVATDTRGRTASDSVAFIVH